MIIIIIIIISAGVRLGANAHAVAAVPSIRSLINYDVILKDAGTPCLGTPFPELKAFPSAAPRPRRGSPDTGASSRPCRRATAPTSACASVGSTPWAETILLLLLLLIIIIIIITV